VERIYDVWAQRKHGEAELARAESNRQIKTLEAKAAMESAKHLADAEIIRSRGVAEANKIIGDSLQGNEGYLRYLWIQGLQTNQMQVVYVPTEANLPIMEANRFK
jgi:regulator of protease activity HflC (stomatin/prohibitin superfamily)